jgi:filamentous hemagglutinin
VAFGTPLFERALNLFQPDRGYSPNADITGGTGGGGGGSLDDNADLTANIGDDAGEVAKDPHYIPRDEEGKLVPLPSQRTNDIDIPTPDPDAVGPHTTLGAKVSGETGETYRQSATFPEWTWPTANGKNVPWSRVDWGTHGRPDVHTNPHQHEFYYDWIQRMWREGPPKRF